MVLDVRKPFSRAQARAAGLPLARLAEPRVPQDRARPVRRRGRCRSPRRSELRRRSTLLRPARTSATTPRPNSGERSSRRPARRHVSLPSDHGRSVRRGLQLVTWRPWVPRPRRISEVYASRHRSSRSWNSRPSASTSSIWWSSETAWSRRSEPTPERPHVRGRQHGGRGRGSRDCSSSGRTGPIRRRFADGVAICGCCSCSPDLPEPEVNLILRGARGEWQRRFDMYYKRQRLVGGVRRPPTRGGRGAVGQ